MVEYTTQASWVLIAASIFSILYELYRATLKAGVSRFDSMRSWLLALPVYAVAIGIAVLVRTGWLWTVWLTLVLSVTLIGVSIFYYGPVALPPRRPGVIDHFEDRVYTGLLFVAAALLIYHLFGTKLSP